MPKFSITAVAQQLLVTTPYNPTFISEAKSDLGAKWNGSEWVFDIRDKVDAMKLIEAVYGWTPGMQLVSVSAQIEDEVSAARGPVVLMGQVLAAATGRDSGARLGDGVRLQSGEVSSGGSVKNWRTDVMAGSGFILHDIPLAMAQDFVAGRRKFPGVTVELLESPLAVNVAALTAERSQLHARLAEIDVLITQTEPT